LEGAATRKMRRSKTFRPSPRNGEASNGTTADRSLPMTSVAPGTWSSTTVPRNLAVSGTNVHNNATSYWSCEHFRGEKCPQGVAARFRCTRSRSSACCCNAIRSAAAI